MRRLFPDPAEVEVADLLEDFPPEGPYLALNMVASVDGRAALTGRTDEPRRARPTTRCSTACASGWTACW